MPSSATARAVVRFQAHIGGRKKRGRWPIVRLEHVLRALGSARAGRRGSSFVMLRVRPGVVADRPCRASRSARTMPGDCLTLLADHEERRADVQRAAARRRICSVNGPGPSSNVSATRPLRTGGAMRCDRPAAQLEDGPVAVDRGRLRDGARRARGELGRTAPASPADRGAPGADGAARCGRRRRRRRRRATTAIARCRRRRAAPPRPPAAAGARTCSSGAERRRPPRRRARRRALRGQLEARVDHDEAGELRAEHDAVGVAEARQRAAARDHERRRRRSSRLASGALAPPQRAHDAAEQRDACRTC